MFLKVDQKSRTFVSFVDIYFLIIEWSMCFHCMLIDLIAIDAYNNNDGPDMRIYVATNGGSYVRMWIDNGIKH